MKKFWLLFCSAVLTLSLVAQSETEEQKKENPFQKWSLADAVLRKEKEKYYTLTENGVSFKNSEKSFLYFSTASIPAEKGDKFKISFTAEGEGNIGAGFFVYKEGWSLLATDIRSRYLDEKVSKVEFIVVIGKENATLVRPVISMGAGAEITLSDFKIEKQ